MTDQRQPLAAAFLARFEGLDRAHGEYATTGEVSAKGKAQGRANTVRTGPTELLWEKHLAGKQRLGVVPITDEGTCRFGAIDIDQYPLDLPELESRIVKLGLPLTVCRSKSGGAHLYLFTGEPVAAALLRDKLAEWAGVLGYPGVEVFPKQSKLANRDDVGNWINMPYFDADMTACYALLRGEAISAAQFLALAKERAVSDDALRHWHVDSPDLPGGAPPCLQSLAHNGVPEGSRNNSLFAFAVLARKMHEGGDDPDGWRDTAGRFNEEFLDPPLNPREVSGVLKSVSGKNYFYPCTTEPLASVCQKKACRKAGFGIGGDDGPDEPEVMIDRVVKVLTDPPTWIFTIAGINVELETDDFLLQSRFKRRVVEKLNRVPRTLKQGKWEEFINKLLQSAEEEQAPEDAGTFGQFLTHLYDFCNRQSRGTTEESLLTNGLYHDEEGGRIYFRSTALHKYLGNQKFHEYSDKQVWQALRKVEGVQHGGTNIKGRFVNHWSIPEANLQDGDFDVPRLPEEEF
jgi:hypothetical protein